MDCVGLQASYYFALTYRCMLSCVSIAFHTEFCSSGSWVLNIITGLKTRFFCIAFLLIICFPFTFCFECPGGRVEFLTLKVVQTKILLSLWKGVIFEASPHWMLNLPSFLTWSSKKLLSCCLCRGIWAMIAVYLAYSLLQAPSTWVVFWFYVDLFKFHLLFSWTTLMRHSWFPVLSCCVSSWNWTGIGLFDWVVLVSSSSKCLVLSYVVGWI